MTTRAELLSAHAELTQVIRASEEWTPGYKKAPKQFKRLIEQEALLQASVTDYFAGLQRRTSGLVNWNEVELKPVMASITPPLGDEAWQHEMQLLQAAVYAYLLETIAIGAEAGEVIYMVPLGISTLDQAVIDAAGTQTAALVKNVTTTSRKLIQTAVQQSILQGEDTYTLMARINRLVTSPVRAEMIAQTESVTAYQSGLEHFAGESGAVSSEWDALAGACRLCSPLEGKTVKIGKMFVLGNGNEVPYPPGHPRCRCSRILNYPES